MTIFSYDTKNPDNYKQSPETGLLQQLHLVGGEKVLDIGCGSGKQCVALCGNGTDVTGIDLQDWMIDYAVQNRSRGNIKYICGDFMNESFEQLQYDLIICQNVMFHIEDKKAFLKKVHGLLKYGGQFAFTDLTKHNTASSPENLAFPVSPDYYSKVLNEVGFSNVLFLWEKNWVWDGVYSGNNYSMFKCNK